MKKKKKRNILHLEVFKSQLSMAWATWSSKTCSEHGVGLPDEYMMLQFYEISTELYFP